MSKPIKTYDLYEVVKVPFPFADANAIKMRPALIISSGKDFNGKIGLSVMAMITSMKSPQHLWPTDLVIRNLEVAGLPAASIIRFKMFTLDHRLVISRLGMLSTTDQEHVQQKLKEIFSL